MTLRRIYHRLVAVALHLVGLDFGWYQTFRFRVIYALPAVEPLLQWSRSRSEAEKVLGGREVLRFAKPGDTVLDIGANVGKITSVLLSLGLTVHAFEPDSRCMALLYRRFKWFGGKRLHLHHCAVASRSGTLTLNYGATTTESNTILPDRSCADGSAGVEVVEARGIIDILDDVGYAPLIKMDIEGAEYDVLDTMLQPEHLGKFGVCLVEAHARKIPALMLRHAELEKRIAAMGLTDRVLLTWH